MKIAFTFPGRFGDILWAMPSARAIAETYDQPIDLIISPKYGSIAELLWLQPYLASVTVDPAWDVREEAPMQPRIPPAPIAADLVVHGGYEGWPARPLPYEIWNTAAGQISKPYSRVPDLHRPWITVFPWQFIPDTITIGFSDEWFELKFGVSQLLSAAPALDGNSGFYLAAPGSRWTKEAGLDGIGWIEAARRIAVSDVFFGCCSALHVLAIAIGKPCVIMEPNSQRHHSIFWPLGMAGPQVWCVLGGDGQPTFDARHCADTLTRVLQSVRQTVTP